MSTHRRICKPSRKLFEQECQRLGNEIQNLKDRLTELKCLLGRLSTELDTLKVEKNKRFEEKNQLENAIRLMSVDINKLSDKLAQLKSKIHYRDMGKLEDAIRKLQVHLDSHHFKLSEERKIVAEIDKLNRSKKVVGEYLTVQNALKEMRSNQHSKRTDRDRCMKAIAQLRSREMELRKRIGSNKENEAQVRSDIDNLYQDKTVLKADFTERQQDYAKYKESLKAEQIRTRLEQGARKRSNQCVHHIPNRLKTVKDEPVDQDVITYTQLIEYCEKLLKSCTDEKSTHKQKKRPISYTPDILSMFISLDVCPPMTAMHAEGCMNILKQKLSALTSDTVHPPTQDLLAVENDNSEHFEDIDENVSNEEVPDGYVPDKIASDEYDNSVLVEAQLADDGSDVDSLVKQLSLASEDGDEFDTKKITSILDSLVLAAENDHILEQIA